MTNIIEAMANCGIDELSMRAIAETVGVTPSRLYAVAKKPIPGQVYDPEAKNWDAVSEYVEERLDAEKFDSMESFVTAAKETEMAIAAAGHRASAGSKKTVEVDGVNMPERKASCFEMGSENEKYLCFKGDCNVYKMVYQTIGYTVIRAVNEDGTFAGDTLRVLSNGTLNTKCVAPYTLDDAAKERFSGEYAEKLRAEAEKAEAKADESDAVAE